MKSECEMGLLLDHAQKVTMNDNLQAKESMKKIGTVSLQSHTRILLQIDRPTT